MVKFKEGMVKMMIEEDEFDSCIRLKVRGSELV